MRQGATQSGEVSGGRRWALTYPNRREHGVLSSLFPRHYARFLLTGLTGKVIILLALACGFVPAAAFASGQLYRALLYVIPLAGLGFSVYELLAWQRVRLLDRPVRPLQPGGIAVLILALSGACFLLSVPVGWTITH